MTWASALSIHRLLTGPDSLVVVRLFGARPFWLQLFEIVDFRKRSVGGGVFYGPAPNVLGFVFFPVDPALRGRQGRDVLVWLVDTSNY